MNAYQDLSDQIGNMSVSAEFGSIIRQELEIEPLDVDRIGACEIVFLCAGAAVSHQIVPGLRDKPCFLADNTSARC